MQRVCFPSFHPPHLSLRLSLQLVKRPARARTVMRALRVYLTKWLRERGGHNASEDLPSWPPLPGTVGKAWGRCSRLSRRAEEARRWSRPGSLPSLAYFQTAEPPVRENNKHTFISCGASSMAEPLAPVMGAEEPPCAVCVWFTTGRARRRSRLWWKIWAAEDSSSRSVTLGARAALG